jgi:hypothetical protein
MSDHLERNKGNVMAFRVRADHCDGPIPAQLGRNVPLISAATLLSIVHFINYISWRSKTADRYFEGTPKFLVRNGHVKRETMAESYSVSLLSAAWIGLSQRAKHHHYSIACEFAAMRARIAHKRLNELQRRRLLRWASSHNPVPLLIGEQREVLHRLHISPTGQRFPRTWDIDVPPGALSAALKPLTMACQLVRVFDCGRAPWKGEVRNQPNRQGARTFHRHLAPSRTQ